MLRAALLAAILLTPLAAASSTLGAGPVALDVQDARGDDCVQLATVCAFQATGATDPGDARVGTEQDVEHVGITVAGPVPADRDVDTGSFSVPDPVMPLVGSTWTSSLLSPGVPGVFELAFDDASGCTSLSHPVPEWHTFTFCSPDGQNRIGYHQIGPFNQFGDSDTDTYVHDTAYGPCVGPTDSPTCQAAAGAALSAWTSATPDVGFGLNVEDVEVASQPS